MVPRPRYTHQPYFAPILSLHYGSLLWRQLTSDCGSCVTITCGDRSSRVFVYISVTLSGELIVFEEHQPTRRTDWTQAGNFTVTLGKSATSDDRSARATAPGRQRRACRYVRLHSSYADPATTFQAFLSLACAPAGALAETPSARTGGRLPVDNQCITIPGRRVGNPQTGGRLFCAWPEGQGRRTATSPRPLSNRAMTGADSGH
jgi:hypothetical protein